MAAGLILVIALAAAGKDPAAVPAGIPADVRMLIERREACGHWAGEEPYDADRAREIANALRGGRCDRIDRDEARVRRRYAKRPDILRLIEETRDGD